MSALEIVAGVLLILSSVVLIWIVLSQDSKGQGLGGVITGTDMMSGESRARTKEARQVKFTRVAGIVFFALTILVNLFSALMS